VTPSAEHPADDDMADLVQEDGHQDAENRYDQVGNAKLQPGPADEGGAQPEERMNAAGDAEHPPAHVIRCLVDDSAVHGQVLAEGGSVLAIVEGRGRRGKSKNPPQSSFPRSAWERAGGRSASREVLSAADATRSV